MNARCDFMQLGKIGFSYQVEVVDRHGNVIDRETVDNIIPTEGLNHLLATELLGGTPITTWYLLLFKGDYTPVAGDTAATFPGSATEATEYDNSTRHALVLASTGAGTVSNTASKVEAVFNATVTIYGAAIVSASAKGATTGVLLSAAKFASTKPMTDDAILRVTAGIALTPS